MSIASNQNLRTTSRRVALGEILTLVNGRAYKQAELLNTGTPVIRIQNLNGGERWYYSDLSLPTNKYCEDGDLLFAWSATFGPYYWHGPKAIYHYHIWKVLPSSVLDKQYAFYLLQSITSRVKAAGRGISMIHMTKSGMEAWEVDLPPLSEQKRIAAILDKADQLRQKRKQAIALLDRLTQSIFLEMFGGEEIVTRLEDICFRITDGTHQAPVWADTGIPFLFVSNIRNQSISFETNKFVSKEEYHRLTKNCPIEPGDVLYTAVGSYGNAAAVPIDKTFIFQRHIAHIKPILAQVNPIYLAAALESAQVRLQADRFARGVAQKTVTLTSLRDFTIPFPSIEQQRLYERRILKVKSVLLSQKMEKLDSLFASLQHRAFSGQL